MLKLKTTAKEAAAELKNHGYRLEWKVATRTYTATDNYASVTIYARYGTAEADSIQKENELVAAFPGFFAYIEDVIEEANQETAEFPTERADKAAEATSEGSAPTEAENAAEGAENAHSEEAADLTISMPGLVVSLPRDGFTDAAMKNLSKLVDAKASLISKALGTDNLDITVDNETVSFPWWDRMPDLEEVHAYMAFIAAIARMAKEAKRVNATSEREIESEKYAFRGFLLRLGFIGSGCAAQRKILLKRLSGSASFPSAEKYTTFCSTQKAKRDAEKEVS